MRLSSFKFNASSLLIGFTGFLMAGFLVSAAYDLWGYWRLEKKTMAHICRWKVIEKSSSQFAIRASYVFEHQGKEYRGRTTFSKPYHLNGESAKKQIKKYALYSWPVWYSPRNPHQSSIERKFPLKKCLYSLMVVGVFLYFVSRAGFQKVIE